MTAVTTVAEAGDLRRFDHPRQLMAFLGLVPSERSTGATRHQGGITKMGNSSARKATVNPVLACSRPQMQFHGSSKNVEKPQGRTAKLC
jgi:transposase